MTTTEVQELADAMCCALPQLDTQDQQIAIGLYRLMTRGRPVSPVEIAAASGAEESRVTNVLETWPAVSR